MNGQPVARVRRQLAARELALERGSGFFHHGHTYLGHPVACAAALAELRQGWEAFASVVGLVIGESHA